MRPVAASLLSSQMSRIPCSKGDTSHTFALRECGRNCSATPPVPLHRLSLYGLPSDSSIPFGLFIFLFWATINYRTGSLHVLFSSQRLRTLAISSAIHFSVRQALTLDKNCFCFSPIDGGFRCDGYPTNSSNPNGLFIFLSREHFRFGLSPSSRFQAVFIRSGSKFSFGTMQLPLLSAPSARHVAFLYWPAAGLGSTSAPTALRCF